MNRQLFQITVGEPEQLARNFSNTATAQSALTPDLLAEAMAQVAGITDNQANRVRDFFGFDISFLLMRHYDRVMHHAQDAVTFHDVGGVGHAGGRGTTLGQVTGDAWRNPEAEGVSRIRRLYGGTWEFSFRDDTLVCTSGPMAGAFFTREQVMDGHLTDPHVGRGGSHPQIAQLPVLKEHRDAEGRYHCEDGPALILTNGMTHWFWHGLECDAFVILNPRSIILDQIINCRAQEYARAMLARYRTADQTRDLSGAALFVQDCIAKDLAEELDHNEPIGTLWCVELECGIGVHMVEVVNRTANPDGTFTHYWRRVPSDIFSARAAVAWTWGLEASEYKPVAES